MKRRSESLTKEEVKPESMPALPCTIGLSAMEEHKIKLIKWQEGKYQHGVLVTSLIVAVLNQARSALGMHFRNSCTELGHS